MASPERPADRPSDASEELARHARLVRALAGEVARDAEEADELAASALAEAVARRPAAGPGLRVWFRRVVSRLAWRGRRRDDERRRREQSSEEAGRARSSEEATVDLVARLELSGHVAAAFAELDEPSRQVLFLRYFDDFPPRTIATQLGLPVETVKTRIKRGLARLRERLDARYGGARSQWHAVAISLSGPGGGVVAMAKSKVAILAAAVVLSTCGWIVVQQMADQRGVGNGVEDLASAFVAKADKAGEAASDPSASTAPAPAAQRVAIGALPFASGRVVDRFGKPLADVRVMAGVVDLDRFGLPPYRESLRVDREAAVLTQTGRDGTFVVVEPTPDLVSLCFLRDGEAVVERRDLSAEPSANQALEVVLPEGMTVAGRVVDTSGAPIDRAEVWVFASRNRRQSIEWRVKTMPGEPTVRGMDDWPMLAVESAADGTFRLATVPDEEFVASIVAHGYEHKEERREDLEPDGEYVLRRGCVFLDVVDGGSGAALTDAVALLLSGEGIVQREFTAREFTPSEFDPGWRPPGRIFVSPASLQPDGKEGLPPSLLVRAEGYHTTSVPIALREGEEPPVIRVALEPGNDRAVLAGVVRGGDVGGAQIEVRLAAGWMQTDSHHKEPVARARVASDGRFETAGLPPARYRVDAIAPNCARCWKFVTAPAGDLDFVLEPEARLVVTARAGDGTVVPGTTVLVQTLDAMHAWASPVDLDGCAAFTGLPAGAVHVWLTLDRRGTYREQAPLMRDDRLVDRAATVALVAGEEATLTLPPPAEREVTFRVTERDGVRPLAATIQVQVVFASSPYDDAGVRQALIAPHPTDSNGEMGLALFHGVYLAHVHAAGVESRIDFRVPHEGPAEVEFRLPVGGGTARLHGRITDLVTGAPLSARRIVGFLSDDSPDEGTQLQTTSDEDGRYMLEGMPTGQIAIVVYDVESRRGPSEFGPASRALALRAGDDHEIDFALARYSPGDDPARTVAFSLRVIDAESGEALPDAIFDLDGQEAGAHLSLAIGETDSTGAFIGRVARTASYRLCVDGPIDEVREAPLHERVVRNVVPVDGAIDVEVRLKRKR